MKIVIIEDEKLTAEDLAITIKKLLPDSSIVATLYSVRESLFFFEQKPEVDLVFSDIQPGDGTSFDIFSQIKVQAPVIFCTAYDEYALDAFKANGIDYILKPFSDEMIKAALDKYQLLKGNAPAPQYPSIEQLLKQLSQPKTESHGAVLVHYKEKILPIAIADIAFFFLKNGVTHLATFDHKTYYLNKTLDELEKTAGTAFFRVNRQYLVNRKAVLDAENYSSRKLAVSLSVPAEEVVLVSKEKMPQFLHWLTII
jgi:DNA-binding LytR/AlgR family response regulator